MEYDRASWMIREGPCITLWEGAQKDFFEKGPFE